MATIRDPNTGQLIQVPDRPPGQGPGVMNLPARTPGGGPTGFGRAAPSLAQFRANQARQTGGASPGPPGQGGFPFGAVAAINAARQRQNQAPRTGLIGSEQALQGGLSGATGALEQAQATARGDITQGLGQGIGLLQGAQGLAGEQFAAGQRQLGAARGQVSAQGAQGRQALTQAGELARGQIGQGVGALDPFRQTGLSAQEQQGALSGAFGAEAQRQAFADFQESPEQAFLREQGQRSVLANAAATGGVQGGNVLRELTRFGTGLASQDIQNRFSRLGALSGQGLTAAGQIGSLRGQGAGIEGQLGTAGASLAGQIGGQLGSLGQAGAGLFGQQAGLTGQLGQAGAGLLQTGGQNLANIATGTGGSLANLIAGTGQQVAAGRTRAGEQIAGQIGGTTSGLANLINQQGTGLAGLIGQGSGNLADLISGLGGQQAGSNEQLAQLLANISTQSAGQVAGLPGVGQFAGQQNPLANAQALLGGLSGLAGAFPQQQAPPDIATINTGAQFAGFA